MKEDVPKYMIFLGGGLLTFLLNEAYRKNDERIESYKEMPQKIALMQPAIDSLKDDIRDLDRDFKDYSEKAFTKAEASRTIEPMKTRLQVGNEFMDKTREQIYELKSRLSRLEDNMNKLSK